MYNFKICLIGMSGVGKSHWTKLITEAGASSISCDLLIARKIVNKLADSADEAALYQELGLWLGFPWQEGYKSKYQQYYEYEAKFMADLAFGEADYDIIDSTGSLIYCPESTLEGLKKRYHLVYLNSSTEKREEMLQNYSENPRPILWPEKYLTMNLEDPAVLASAYADLIESRHQQYLKWADQVLEFDQHYNCPAVPDFINLLKND